MNLPLAGTSRCDVPARAVAGGTNTDRGARQPLVAPLDAARTAQRAVPTWVKRVCVGFCFFIFRSAGAEEQWDRWLEFILLCLVG